jgi:hypothetical protein
VDEEEGWEKEWEEEEGVEEGEIVWVWWQWGTCYLAVAATGPQGLGLQ